MVHNVFLILGGNKCYKAVPLSLTDGVTHFDAFKLCREELGLWPDLVSIHSAEENGK